MVYEDELLITYGLGYAFDKSKLLIVSEIEEKTVAKKELDIMKEITIINKLKEKLHTKCGLNHPKNYIASVEDALEEKLSRTIPIITSIRVRGTKKHNYLMDEYVKRDLSQVRLRKEGYVQKDFALIKEYLDKCSNVDTIREDKIQNPLRYNKIIFKIILTTSFGNDLGLFLTKQGQAKPVDKDDVPIGRQLEDVFKNDYLVKKKYNELDFLNMLLFLEEWQKKHFNWDEKYTSLMFSVNKDGKKYKGKKSEIKDYVISFIKEKRYLYFPFGKYNEENIFITINDMKYCNKDEKNINFNSKSKYTILEKKDGNLYQIISNDYKEINLEYNCELGYLLFYENDEVYISFIIYDENNQSIIYRDGYHEFKEEMVKALEDHFIL